MQKHAFRDVLSFSKKKLIYKEMCGTVKIKSFKNVIMKNVGYRRFSNLCKYSMQ